MCESAVKAVGTISSMLVLCLLPACTQEMANQRRVEYQEYASKLPKYNGDDESLQNRVPAVNAAIIGFERASAVNADETRFSLQSIEQLERGRDRYNIWCAPCHDITGSGNGMVAQRGLKYPPSYHTDRLRNKSAEYIYAVATHGFKTMPAYKEIVANNDRRDIALYIKALQLSQHAPGDLLQPQDLQRLNEGNQQVQPKVSLP